MSARRVALVTGSGKRRVGWHVADFLGQHGFALAVHYRESSEAAQSAVTQWREQGIDAAAFGADLGDESAVRSLVEQVIARWGRLDLLVTCAAIWERKSLEQVTADDVRRHFEVNTLGTFLCVQHAGLAMVRQADGGCIVTIGDWADARPYRDYAAYFPSKGAIPALTRTMAVELGMRNPHVRVNCILPGPVMLPPDLPADERQRAIAATLVQREGSPDHIARAVWHFVENDFVTGTCLPVDGGRSIYSTDSR